MVLGGAVVFDLVCVVVASSCRLLGSSVGSFSELFGALRVLHARVLNGCVSAL
jgi:hypothetical protein